MATLGQDILTTACEGGINYFADVTDCERTPELDWKQVTIRPTDDDFGPITVKATQLEAAAREMVKPAYDLNSEMKANIALMLKERDAGNIDAYDAQAIFQHVAFGEQVYG